jgi:hypothetical protein
MWGRLTLTTEVSSTSITALDITAIATIQRWLPERIGDGSDAEMTEGPGWGADWTVGSETGLLEAEIRLGKGISGPAQSGF